MCIYAFAPGNVLHVDYAGESVTLEKGAIESIIDILVTNHSSTPIDRVSIVYPHAVQLEGQVARSKRRRRSPYLRDETDTWCQQGHSYNRFYDDVQVEEINDGLRVSVRIADPANRLQPYVGWIRGRRRFTPYEPSPNDRLRTTEWRLLSHLGWAVATVTFGRPIEPQEARWLRFVGYSGVLRQNSYPRVEEWVRKLGGILVHTFEIAGPYDVKYRIARDLRKALEMPPASPAQEFTRTELLMLREALLANGMERPGTDTVVQDWRLNVFEKRYRILEQPDFEGDIVPSSPLRNMVQLQKNGRHIEVFQWKAGRRNIPRASADGLFQVRLAAHDIPLFTVLASPLSLVLSVVALVVTLVGANC